MCAAGVDKDLPARRVVALRRLQRSCLNSSMMLDVNNISCPMEDDAHVASPKHQFARKISTGCMIPATNASYFRDFSECQRKVYIMFPMLWTIRLERRMSQSSSTKSSQTQNEYS
jgi:hypothetical protein